MITSINEFATSLTNVDKNGILKDLCINGYYIDKFIGSGASGFVYSIKK